MYIFFRRNIYLFKGGFDEKNYINDGDNFTALWM